MISDNLLLEILVCQPGYLLSKETQSGHTFMINVDALDVLGGLENKLVKTLSENAYMQYKHAI